MSLEQRVRALWPDFRAEGYSLASCMYLSLDQMRGEIYSFVPPQKRQHVQPSLTGGPKPLPSPDHKRPGSERFEKAKASFGFVEGVRTARSLEDGKLICKHYNDRRNNTDCPYGARCSFAHACDVIVDGKVCGSRDHHRLTHV